MRTQKTTYTLQCPCHLHGLHHNNDVVFVLSILRKQRRLAAIVCATLHLLAHACKCSNALGLVAYCSPCKTRCTCAADSAPLLPLAPAMLAAGAFAFMAPLKPLLASLPAESSATRAAGCASASACQLRQIHRVSGLRNCS